MTRFSDNDGNDIVDVNVTLYASTQKAVLIAPGDKPESHAAWVSKELVFGTNELGRGVYGEIGMRKWIADKEGFKYD